MLSDNVLQMARCFCTESRTKGTWFRVCNALQVTTCPWISSLPEQLTFDSNKASFFFQTFSSDALTLTNRAVFGKEQCKTVLDQTLCGSSQGKICLSLQTSAS